MPQATLIRETFSTSRALEYFSEDELNRQMGAPRDLWALMLVKELIDNALDACEAVGVAPAITVTVGQDALTVADNGPGLPRSVLEGSLDYLVRVSDKTHYVSPTRGQLGNALKLLWAAPFVACGDAGWVGVRTPEATHEVRVTLNRLEQKPVVNHVVGPASVKNGTAVTFHWPGIASYLDVTEDGGFYRFTLPNLLRAYGVFNPHAALVLNGEPVTGLPAAFAKWTAAQPTSAHWYTPARLRDLVAGTITSGGGATTVRDFVAKFDGLSATAKRKAVTDACGLSGVALNDLVAAGDVATPLVAGLHGAMCRAAKAVKAERLGVLGRDHLQGALAHPESVRCAPPVKGMTADGLPFVLEVAFGYLGYGDIRRVTTGLNFSPTLGVPFAELEAALGDNRIDSHDPVEVVVHLACPRLEFTDDGKTRLRLPPEVGAALREAVAKVAKEHKKAKRRAEQLDEQAYRQAARAHRLSHYGIKEACFAVIGQAYLAASGGGRYPAQSRQIMYAARPLVLELTGGKWYTDSRSLTSSALPEFIDAHPDLTAGWDVVFDARGQLREPYTNQVVELGTLQVRDYLASWTDRVTGPLRVSVRYRAPTCGPANRYAYALFIEKEGFYPLLEAARVADRYGIAVMSTKGMSTVAARRLVDELSARGVTILVARDFDKAGFSIAATLATDTERYRFRNAPRVIDIGLCLDDVTAMGLQSEPVEYGNADPRANLWQNGATDDEIDFLCRERRGGRYLGARVELNAMTSDQFVAWLERKLAEAGVAKVIPDDDALADGYRHARKLVELQRRIDEAVASLPDEPLDTDGLAERVADLVTGTELAWDEALWRLACRDDEKAA